MSTRKCVYYEAHGERRIIMGEPGLCDTACSQGEKSKSLAALDEAYRSGVLTLSEYQTKKAAIEAAAAKIATIEKAHADGVLSVDEYVAKKSAIPTGQPAVPASTMPASADGHSYRMRSWTRRASSGPSSRPPCWPRLTGNRKARPPGISRINATP